MKPETKALRVGKLPTDEKSHNTPIFLTSSFTFDSAEHAAAVFAGEEAGNVYSRFTNPTVRAFEERLAALEGGERCVAFASGMAAITALPITFLSAGDHLVCARQVFGSIPAVLNGFIAKFGIEITFIDGTDISAWENAVQDNTKMFFLETPSNPLGAVIDIRAVADVAAKHDDIIFAVDNCFASPALQQPLSLGADLVVHSATKYIDGQGRCIGGAVVGRDELMSELFRYVRTAGACMSPFNAWIFISGLATLHLRMREHCSNALRIATWLNEHEQVKSVYYAGLPTHEQHQLAAAQTNNQFGAVLSFELHATAEQTRQFINATTLISKTANLGDAKSTITQPFSTTHRRLSDEDKVLAGITEGLIRLSVGLEHRQDLLDDLTQGFAAIK